MDPAAAVSLDPDPAHVVGTGGALGAVLRHWVSLRVSAGRFPAATLTVNALGSFALGAAVFAGADGSALLLFGTGVCGSFTTFSSFSVETVGLWERGDRRLAVATAGANLLVSLVAIGLARAAVGTL
nr:CrcB family protein [Salinilacihabitans rarus]